eukprot:6080966-Pyramimonas_sp.AAC.1
MTFAAAPSDFVSGAVAGPSQNLSAWDSAGRAARCRAGARAAETRRGRVIPRKKSTQSGAAAGRLRGPRCRR